MLKTLARTVARLRNLFSLPMRKGGETEFRLSKTYPEVPFRQRYFEAVLSLRLTPAERYMVEALRLNRNQPVPWEKVAPELTKLDKSNVPFEHTVNGINAKCRKAGLYCGIRPTAVNKTSLGRKFSYRFYVLVPTRLISSGR